MTTPRSGPVPVLLAGDEFVLNRLMADELASVAGTGAWALRTLEFPWPSVAFGQVAEVDEAAGTEDQMIEALQGVRVCLTQLAPLTTRILDACPDLELFAVSRGGPVNANLDAATAHGVVVTFAPGRNATATAEYTIGMMLAALRGVADGHLGVSEGRWEASRFVFATSGIELEGTTVGLVGAGAIGSRVARILLGFGARVLVFDPYAEPASLPHGVTSVALDELLSSAQVVSLHARVTPENRNMIGAAELAAMPPGAVLVNCARGALVDHAALADALCDGHLFAAGLDVFDVEPLPADHPLRRAPNVVMTPHLAGASRQVAGNACRMVAAEADRFRRGEPPLHCANPDVLASARAQRRRAMTLLLTRHAETVWHKENRYAGTSDIDLTPHGVEQAGRLAEWVATRRVDAIVCSPVRRARETAAPAAAATGIAIEVDDELREVGFGIAEGRTLAELDPDVVARFRADPVAAPFPGAEPPAVAAERCARRTAPHRGQARCRHRARRRAQHPVAARALRTARPAGRPLPAGVPAARQRRRHRDRASARRRRARRAALAERPDRRPTKSTALHPTSNRFLLLKEEHMTPQPRAGSSWTRRDVLRALGLAGSAAAAAPLLNACGVGGGGGQAAQNGANAVSGGFDWKKASGTSIKILQTPHPYQQSFQPLLQEFTTLTGIQVQADLVAEADYFTKLNTELAGRTGAHDVFMTGAYFIWQYGPPGWMEDLNPWLQNSSATGPDYDFEDIYEGLRTSTRWDFKKGSPLGSGGQWAIPWGFETNVVAYNKKFFDARGIKPAETFDNFIQLANDLTDRSQNRYGVAFRGSKSWASIHPGFMTQFSREGAKDYTSEGGKLQAAMNSPQAVAFTQKWVDLAKSAGPTSWTSYEYPDCTRDLGDGVAMMVYDADSATYPKNKPGASAQAGNLAWHPGPAGPDGSYTTNLWTWSLADELRTRGTSWRRGCSSSGPPARRHMGKATAAAVRRPGPQVGVRRPVQAGPRPPFPATWRPSRR